MSLITRLIFTLRDKKHLAQQIFRLSQSSSIIMIAISIPVHKNVHKTSSEFLANRTKEQRYQGFTYAPQALYEQKTLQSFIQTEKQDIDNYSQERQVHQLPVLFNFTQSTQNSSCNPLCFLQIVIISNNIFYIMAL